MKALQSTFLAACIVNSSSFAPIPSKLRLHQAFKSSTVFRMSSTSDTKHIAIIGAGAAGLASARAFLRCTQFQVSVFESRNRPGGIWDYDSTNGTKKCRPMYKNLRTNLPKELMAFREFPWTGTEESYVTHTEVNRYLNDYCRKFGLENHIHYGCNVEQLTVTEHDDNEQWPRIELQWKCDGKTVNQTFDNVLICNGHYALPSYPNLQGIDAFKGRVIHAIEYDNPDEYKGKTVLCIGARASGVDIAREIGLVANKVYLSDSTSAERKEFDTNVVLMPRTQCVDEDGVVHFYSTTANQKEKVEDIDVIIFCSGYDYGFPFINKDSNLDLQFVAGERRVSPLYEQLWHANYPSISFIGLPHSVVPFPLFKIQANAVRKALQQHNSGLHEILPSLSERLQHAEKAALNGGPDDPGRVQDTHFLGSHQWNYCRRLAKLSGFYDEDTENYIATNKVKWPKTMVMC